MFTLVTVAHLGGQVRAASDRWLEWCVCLATGSSVAQGVGEEEENE